MNYDYSETISIDSFNNNILIIHLYAFNSQTLETYYKNYNGVH